MKNRTFLPKAPKQTVSLTLNSDLYAKAKAAGINASRVAEEALASAYDAHCREAARAEAERDLAAIDAYAGVEGSFAEHVRRHYELDDGAV